MKLPPLSAVALALVLSQLPSTARAETHHRCTGFIDAVPAVVSTPGVWCLRADLNTAITSGDAIRLNASNVTLDCNGFRVNGTPAVKPWNARGIVAMDRSGITVRNCLVQAFRIGIYLGGGNSHAVLDNRVAGSRDTGLHVNGELSSVRRNRVSDIGDEPSGGNVYGIFTAGDSTVIAENQISDLTVPDNGNEVVGIFAGGGGARVLDNHITNLLPGTGPGASGIRASQGPRGVIRGNTLVNVAPATGWGISTGAGATAAVCIDNVVRGFASGAVFNCIDGGGNYLQ